MTAEELNDLAERCKAAYRTLAELKPHTARRLAANLAAIDECVRKYDFITLDYFVISKENEIKRCKKRLGKE